MFSFENVINFVESGFNNVVAHCLMNWGAWKVFQETAALSYADKLALCGIMFLMFLCVHEANKARKK
jgi:hypothetical protein